MPKAIALPINILVIVAVATIAMLGLIGVYGVGYNPFSSAMGAESAKNTACRQLVFGGCKANTSDIKVNYSSVNNLFDLCKNVFGRTDEKSCKQLCGCVGGTVSGGGPTGGGISLSPSIGSTAPGGTLSSTVTVTRFNSTVSETVSLSLSGCPAGSTCTLSAPSCNANPSCSVTLAIVAGPNPGGPYTITVTGTGATTGITKTATYKLTISVSCTCSDGTSCGQCSNVNKPKWCDSSGNLISNQCNAPHNCPCPAALPSCNAGTGVCSAAACTCSDGTSCGQCSNVNKPKWCDATGNLIPNQCGASHHNCLCPGSQTCNADGSCSVAVCSCNWENDACGGGGCTVFVFWCGQWQRCHCNIPNCGTCGGSPEGALFCNSGVVCGLVGVNC